MANIKELIHPHKILYKTLRCAGNLGEDQGLECYVVGGAVLDLFLHRKIMEVDIMVVGDGIAFAKELKTRLKAILFLEIFYYPYMKGMKKNIKKNLTI